MQGIWKGWRLCDPETPFFGGHQKGGILRVNPVLYLSAKHCARHFRRTLRLQAQFLGCKRIGILQQSFERCLQGQAKSMGESPHLITKVLGKLKLSMVDLGTQTLQDSAYKNWSQPFTKFLSTNLIPIASEIPPRGLGIKSAIGGQNCNSGSGATLIQVLIWKAHQTLEHIHVASERIIFKCRLSWELKHQTLNIALGFWSGQGYSLGKPGIKERNNHPGKTPETQTRFFDCVLPSIHQNRNAVCTGDISALQLRKLA